MTKKQECFVTICTNKTTLVIEDGDDPDYIGKPICSSCKKDRAKMMDQN